MWRRFLGTMGSPTPTVCCFLGEFSMILGLAVAVPWWKHDRTGASAMTGINAN